MQIEAHVAAEGLAFPEGPLVLPDGRIAFVEMYRGCVSVLEDGKVRQLAYLGGSPNGLALASDGRIYVARPEGRVGEWMSPDRQPPAIVAVNPDDGSHEVLTTTASGHDLRAPNDLCFGPDGAVYFTDPGAVAPDDPDLRAWICRLDANGCEIVHELRNVFTNGIGFDRSGRLVWAETWTRRLVSGPLDGGDTDELVELPEDASPDGFAYTDDGRCVVATVGSGGLDLVDWTSGVPDVERLTWAPAVVAVNVAFDGTTMWVTDVSPTWDDPSDFKGRLWKLTTELSAPRLMQE